MSSPKNRRVAVFIDGLNMRYRLDECQWYVDPDVLYLAERLAGNRQLVGAFYYVASPNQEHLGKVKYWHETEYLRRVDSQPGVDVRYGYMASRRTPQGTPYWIEKAVDVQLASDLIYLAATDQYDVAVIVSADGDLCPAIRAARALGCRVELVFFKCAKAFVGQLIKDSDMSRAAKRSHFRSIHSATS